MNLKTSKIMYKCKKCQKEFIKPQSLAAHSTHCGKKDDPEYKERRRKVFSAMKKSKKVNSEKRKKIFLEKEHICEY